jgi:hypothetical protein
MALLHCVRSGEDTWRAIVQVLPPVLSRGQYDATAHVTLSDRLTRTAPAETGGVWAAQGLGFQRDWILTRILELHERDEPYLVLCEWHEDAVILDQPATPTTAEFCQVKGTSAGSTRLGDLLSPRRGSRQAGTLLPSALSRLAKCCDDFSAFAPRGTLITSASLTGVKLRSGASKVRFAFADLDNATQERILEALTRDLGVADATALAERLRFEITALSFLDHSSHAQGRLSAFVERARPDRKYRPGPLYQALVGEIERKSIAMGPFTSFDELGRRKGIDRHALDKYLDAAVPHTDADARWMQVEGRLNREGMAYETVRALRDEWVLHEASLMNPTDTSLGALRERIGKEIEAYRRAGPVVSLSNLGASVSERIGAADGGLAYRPEYVQAAVYWEVEASVDWISPPSEESQGET